MLSLSEKCQKNKLYQSLFLNIYLQFIFLHDVDLFIMQQNNNGIGEDRNMVNSISSIGNFQNTLLQSIGSYGSSDSSSIFDSVLSKTQTDTTEASDLSSADDSTQTASNDSTGVTSMGGGSSSSSQTNSEMDLNKDGPVTMDEIIQYMQMQMLDEMSEEMGSEEGSSHMASQSQNSYDTTAFKTQQAASAYQSGQQLLSSVTDMISDSFMA